MLLPSTTGQLPPGPGAWGSGSYSSYYGPGGVAPPARRGSDLDLARI